LAEPFAGAFEELAAAEKKGAGGLVAAEAEEPRASRAARARADARVFITEILQVVRPAKEPDSVYSRRCLPGRFARLAAGPGPLLAGELNLDRPRRDRGHDFAVAFKDELLALAALSCQSITT
jgi:hypothetical protein